MSGPVRSGRRCCLGFACALTLAALPAIALDPHRAVSQYSVRSWRGGADFPQDPTVQSIVQTPDGYLWLGTMEGLLRFDGVRTTRFAGPAAGLPHDNVWGLRVTTDGRLWAGTDGGGIVVWNNGPERRLTKADGLSADAIRPILQTRDGAVWIGTARHGIDVWKDGRWRHLTRAQGLTEDVVWSFAEAPDGSVWVGAGGVNLCRGDATACTAVRRPQDGLPGDGVPALRLGRNGDLWVGSWGGLSRLRDGKWTDWRVRDGLPGGIVRAIHEDRDGNIWVGTNEGLTRFRDGTFDRLGRHQGAAGGYVRSLFEDREGTLWVGAVSAGLTALSDGQFLNVGESEGLPPHNVLDALETGDGAFWVGTSKGLTRWRDGTAEVFVDRKGIPNDTIEALLPDRADPQALWIATARGLLLWDPVSGVRRRYTENNGLLSGLIRSLYIDSHGALWVGHARGASVLRDGKWQSYSTEQGMPNGNVFAMEESVDGTMWFGTNFGVARLRDGKLTTNVAGNAGPAMSIYTLYEDADRVLWAGASNGLWRLAKDTWTSFDQTHSTFCSNSVSYMQEDDLGRLWTTSPKGLCRVDRAGLDAFAAGQTTTVPWRLYDRSDGIRDTAFAVGNAPKGGKLRDGRLFFVTRAGLVLVDPRNLRTDTAPPATIEALSADNISVPLAAPIALGPGRPRLELRFTALTLVTPEKLRFRYQLDGFDPDWIDAGGQRAAYYTNIPPGDYAFRVSAVSSDGVWNDVGTPLAFRVKSYVWETSWFRLGCLLAALALGMGAYRWRVRRMREEAAELERRVQEGIKHIQTLKGLLPICASCKKIRDDGGYWNQIESYVAAHSSAEFSHSICPECIAKLYPDYAASRGAPTS